MTPSIDKLIALAEEHDAKAAEGPWEYYECRADDGPGRRNNLRWTQVLLIPDSHLISTCRNPISSDDAETDKFIAASRTAWPATAKALKEEAQKNAELRNELWLLKKKIEAQRQTRIKLKTAHKQTELDAKLAEREARGEHISSFERLQYEACPHLAELLVNLEDELAEGSIGVVPEIKKR